MTTSLQPSNADDAPRPPAARNEPVREYAPGSLDRAELKAALARMSGERIDLPLVIDGREMRTGALEPAVSPHDHGHVLADAHIGGRSEIEGAIAAAGRAWPSWSRAPWQERAGVFMRAADLLAGPRRAELNAATMLGQSKTCHQAEIDAAAELIDFWRFNVDFMSRLYGEQPLSPTGVSNRIDYRPLEGFVFAATPFNFTAIAGNLPSAPALMGNTVVWKPSATARYAAHFVMRLLIEAGLPDGVINLIYADPAQASDIALASRDLAGVHFTGSTGVFNDILRRVGAGSYRNYPRVVGETGGKNFVLAHASADLAALTTAIVRGAFEYQGQKCSAASRIFIPRRLWPELRDRLIADIEAIRMGDVADFRTFMGAVIDEKAWTRLAAAQEEARAAPAVTVLAGGTADKSRGYFVAPTLLEVGDPRSRFMREEFFGPIVSAHLYDEDRYDDVLTLIDETSDYGLTGAVFAADPAAVALAADRLRHAAGNFYINDKPTGAVVGQQPFGGARASGTNDKAGSMWNLARWVSPRTIKETFAPPTDWRYPSMAET
ncbi:MAG: L-glutamate gamma-semialdehyde dehydrogenase [Pseudomonadota bacterium]|nr:L-glutamate gamma-semialdehyde dehydrogenase [Pseudomonadota bacterium]